MKKAWKLDVINENKMKYSFLIYNASVIVYEMIRPFLKPNWIKHFKDIIERFDKLMFEVDEPDYNWRCRLIHNIYK